MSAAIASPRPTRCTRPAASASQMPTWLAWIAGREGGSGAMAAMLGTREERGKGGTRQGRKGLEAPHSSKERKALLAQAPPPEADGPHRAKHLRRRGRHRAARAFQGGIERPVAQIIGKTHPHAVEPGPHDERIDGLRSEEHTSELQSLMRTSYAVFCLKKKHNKTR